MTLVAGDHQCLCVCIYLDQAQFPSSEWNLNDPLKGLLEKCWMRCSLIVHVYMYLLLYEWLKGIHNRKKRKFLGLIQLQPQLLRLCRHQKIWLKFVQLIFSHAKANFNKEIVILCPRPTVLRWNLLSWSFIRQWVTVQDRLYINYCYYFSFCETKTG